MSISRKQRNLYSLGKEKNKIKEILLSNDDLSLLLLSENEQEVSEHIFNYGYFPAANVGSPASIYIETILGDALSSATQNTYIVIDVIVDKQFINLPQEISAVFEQKGYAGNRVDIIMDIIDRALSNGDFGIGPLQKKPVDPMEIIRTETEYYGKEIIYSASHFTYQRT